MIRVVLAVVLSTALLGIAVSSAERADRDRNTALALDELERTADTAERLAAQNDPVASGETPAGTTVTLSPPDPTFAGTGGRFRIDDDELRWEPSEGQPQTVPITIPIHVEAPTVITERTRLRLRYVRLESQPVIRIRPESESHSPRS